MNRLFTFIGILLLAAIVITPIRSSAQTTIPNIDDKAASSWQWCNSCAGGGKTYAVGGVANVTQSGYTVDGSSIRLTLATPPTAYVFPPPAQLLHHCQLLAAL